MIEMYGRVLWVNILWTLYLGINPCWWHASAQVALHLYDAHTLCAGHMCLFGGGRWHFDFIFFVAFSTCQPYFMGEDDDDKMFWAKDNFWEANNMICD